MDRRQQKTREAIFDAFGQIASQKDYEEITIHEICDKANIGRSTFYSHFETKAELVESLCNHLYEHFLDAATGGKHLHGSFRSSSDLKSVFCHILHHVKENDHNILYLLINSSCTIFSSLFKSHLYDFIKKQYADEGHIDCNGLPEDFVVTHLASTFVEMIEWWEKKADSKTAEEIVEYYWTVTQNFIR